MSELRAHFGSRCPRCAKDILQPMPSTNRMPAGKELAWCPSCQAQLSLQDLERPRRVGGFLAKLFGRANEA